MFSKRMVALHKLNAGHQSLVRIANELCVGGRHVQMTFDGKGVVEKLSVVEKWMARKDESKWISQVVKYHPPPPQNTPFSWVYPDGVLTPRGVRRLPGRVFTWSWTPTGPFPLLVGNLLPKAPSGTHKNKAYNRHKMGSKNTSH